MHTVALATLRKKVTDLLDSRPLAVVLRSKGIRVARHSAPKQTETTQRWKVALEGDAGALHTKVVADLSGTFPTSPSSIHADAHGELYETDTLGNVYHLEAGP